jgi:hypothetical protein
MYYLDSEKPKSSIMGRHFMASLLWNTEPDKMLAILKVMGSTYKEYGLPIDYEALGIDEC